MTLPKTTLVQATMADYLRDAHGWRSVMAWNQRDVRRRRHAWAALRQGIVILTRYLSEALVQLNPGLPEVAYKQALREITDIFGSQSLDPHQSGQISPDPRRRAA